MKTIFTYCVSSVILILMLPIITVAQTQENYVPSTNWNVFYGPYDLSYINDGDLTDGTIWSSSSPVEMTMHFSSPVVLSSVSVKCGQFNGNYNAPVSMQLHRGTSAGPQLLNTNPGYLLNTYALSNTTADTIYTWVITPDVFNYASVLEITAFSSCSSSSSFTTTSACESYNSPSGNYTWTTSGTYNDTISNAGGCDSVITINLTVNNANTAVSQSGITLSSNASGAQYQWINCSNMSPVAGATNQSFSATANGNYAVVVTENGCTDTSSCVNVTGVGFEEIAEDVEIEIFPNPCNDYLMIKCDYKIKQIEITDFHGRVLINNKPINGQLDISELNRSVYIIRIYTEEKTYVKSMVKY